MPRMDEEPRTRIQFKECVDEYFPSGIVTAGRLKERNESSAAAASHPESSSATPRGLEASGLGKTD